MKPLIRINARNTPITAQCNVAWVLFRNHSDAAGREVFNSPEDVWESVAQKYADLEYSHEIHQAEWVPVFDRPRLSALDHHSLQEDTRIAQQLTHSPLDRLMRFIGRK